MRYISTNIAFKATLFMPDSLNTDTVTYQIIKASDGSVFASGSMTFLAGYEWTVTFTPTTDDVFILQATNATRDVIYSEEFKSVATDITLYDSLNIAFTAVVAIPGSINTDAVTYNVYRVSTGAVFATGSATFLAGIQWKVAFTPTAADDYVLEVTDTTRDVVWRKCYTFSDAILFPATTLAYPGNLTTLANLKSVLHQDVSTDDTLLKAIITRVSASIASTCNRIFYAHDITEYQDGEGDSTLVAEQYPINSITSIHDDVERAYGSDTLIASTDYVYYSEKGLIKLDNYYFAVGLKNIKLVYNAGYSTVPQDLEMACIKRCMAEYLESAGAINVIEGQDFVYKPKKLRDEADTIIEGYVDYRR